MSSGNKHDEEAVPDLVSLDNVSRLYGSAYRVLDIIELERLAFDAKIIIRQFQMNRAVAGQSPELGSGCT